MKSGMEPASKSPRFYATVPFGLVITIALIGAILAVSSSMPSLEGRPTAGMRQFGVVLLAAYWLFVFPKGRQSSASTKSPGDSKSGDNL